MFSLDSDNGSALHVTTRRVLKTAGWSIESEGGGSGAEKRLVAGTPKGAMHHRQGQETRLATHPPERDATPAMLAKSRGDAATL